MANVRASPFVDRKRELAGLHDALAAASAGRPGVIVLTGEAGIGKSRLVREFAAAAVASGALTGAGGCMTLSTGPVPYVAVVDALESLAGAVGEGWEKIAAAAAPHAVPALRRHAAAAPTGGGEAGGSGEAQARVFAEVLALLGELGRTAPVLLVLEDVHWADVTTLDLVTFLARRAREQRLLLLTTARAEEAVVRQRLRTWLAELERLPTVRRMELTPLSDADTRALIAGALGDDPPAALATDIVRRSGGSPFFAEELLAAAGAGPPGELPATLRDVLGARVAGLGSQARSVLRVAAAAGGAVDQLLLERVLGEHMDDALRELVASGVLAVRDDGRLAFRHALLAEAAYAELLPGERRRLHARFAQALEREPALAGAGAVTTAAAIAGHWDAARVPDRALVAAVHAADAAVRSHALAEAEALLERAVALEPSVPDAERLTGTDGAALRARAAALAAARGRYERAVELLDEAVARLDQAREPVRAGLLRSSRALWGRFAGRPVAEAHLAHADALRLVPADPPSAARARVVAEAASSVMHDGRPGEAIAELRRALELSRAVGAQREEAYALAVLAACISGAGDPASAVGVGEQAVALALALDDGGLVGIAYVMLSAVLDADGRFAEAAERSLEGAAACARLGVLAWEEFLLANAVEDLIPLGRWDEADRLVAQLVDGAVGPLDIGAYRLLRGAIELLRGRFAAAERDLAAARLARSYSVQYEAMLRAHEAALAAWRGRIGEALEAVRGGMAAVASTAGDADAARLLAVAARVEADRAERARALRDDDETQAALAELEEFTRLRAEVRARWRADAPPPAPVAGWDALAAAEAARAHGASEPGMWAELAVAADRLSMRYRAAYARWRQAEALLTRSAPRGEAAQPLRDAHAVAAEIGAEPLLREIVALAQRARITLARAAPAPPAAAAGAALGLTPRELDVLRLLALGRTNPEIAGTLFVSPKTVSTHVTSILRKLGAHTRGEAVAKARRAGVAADPS